MSLKFATFVIIKNLEHIQLTKCNLQNIDIKLY